MAGVGREERLITQIIEAYGPTIDSKGSPELFIEIVRKYGPDILHIAGEDDPDGGSLPGGVGCRTN
jgi:hypothetical protein